MPNPSVDGSKIIKINKKTALAAAEQGLEAAGEFFRAGVNEASGGKPIEFLQKQYAGMPVTYDGEAAKTDKAREAYLKLTFYRTQDNSIQSNLLATDPRVAGTITADGKVDVSKYDQVLKNIGLEGAKSAAGLAKAMYGGKNYGADALTSLEAEGIAKSLEGSFQGAVSDFDKAAKDVKSPLITYGLGLQTEGLIVKAELTAFEQATAKPRQRIAAAQIQKAMESYKP